VIAENGRDHLLDLVGPLRVVHVGFSPCPWAKLKKAGNAHFFGTLARIRN
jgi:hypothetical protein